MYFCVECGKWILDSKRTKYCSDQCCKAHSTKTRRDARHKKQAETAKNITDCRFNAYIDCDLQGDCGKCGWNPEVAQERRRRFMEVHCGE